MAGMTDADFRRAPDPQRQLQLAQAGKLERTRNSVASPPVIAAEKPKGRGMNKTEAEFAVHLDVRKYRTEIRWYGFEAVTLKLADGCRYTPDFCVVTLTGRIEFWEVKGFWRDDARVKIKVAAKLFPWARFVAVTKRRKQDGGGWREEVFSAD